MAVALINKDVIVCMIKWEPLIQSLQFCFYISPIFILEKFCWQLFFFKILYIFQSQAFFCHILAMASPGNVKWKGSASTGFLIIHVTSIYDLTYDFPIDFSGSNYLYPRNCLIDVKRKGQKSVGYWADCVIFSFDHTHDLGLGLFKVKDLITFISGINGRIDREQKGLQLMDLSWPWPWTFSDHSGMAGYTR